MSLSIKRPPAELPETPLASLLNDTLFKMLKSERIKMVHCYSTSDFTIYYHPAAPVFVHDSVMGWQLAYRLRVSYRQGHELARPPVPSPNLPVGAYDIWMSPTREIMGLRSSPDPSENIKNYQDRVWFPTAVAAWQAHSKPVATSFEEYQRGLAAVIKITKLLYVSAACKITNTITNTDKMAVKGIPGDLGFRFLEAILPLEVKWYELATSPSLQEEALRLEVKSVSPSISKRI